MVLLKPEINERRRAFGAVVDGAVVVAIAVVVDSRSVVVVDSAVVEVPVVVKVAVAGVVLDEVLRSSDPRVNAKAIAAAPRMTAPINSAPIRRRLLLRFG